MASEQEFQITANHKWEGVAAAIFGLLAVRSLTLDPPNYFMALLELAVGLIWVAGFWPTYNKEYRIRFSDKGIFFSRGLVKRKEMMVDWLELDEIRKQIIISHRSGLGSHSRFCFKFVTGEKIYLTKSFGRELEEAISEMAKKNGVPFISLG